jgi:hypothetical protein
MFSVSLWWLKPRRHREHRAYTEKKFKKAEAACISIH